MTRPILARLRTSKGTRAVLLIALVLLALGMIALPDYARIFQGIGIVTMISLTPLLSWRAAAHGLILGLILDVPTALLLIPFGTQSPAHKALALALVPVITAIVTVWAYFLAGKLDAEGRAAL